MTRSIRLTVLRRISQIGTLLLLATIPLLCLQQITLVTGTLYSMAVLGLEITDPVMILQHLLATGSSHFGLLASGAIPLVLAVVLGPVFCSWACPQGLLSEIAELLRRTVSGRWRPIRLRTATGGRPLWVTVKWGVLIGSGLLVFLFSYPLFYFLSAPGVISSQLASLIYFGSAGSELALIGLILVLELFWIPRAWCRILCPIGTVLSACRTPIALRVQHELGHRCDAGACGVACVRACQLGIDPRNRKELWLCNNCGDCVEACPDTALRWRFPLLKHPGHEPGEEARSTSTS